MIAITGAAGTTGLAVIQALRERGAKQVRALVSRPASEDKVRRAGATEVVVADFRRRDSMHRALEGASRVYHICPALLSDELQIGLDAMAAAKANGVRHFVFHSVVHSQSDTLVHHRDKRLVEDALMQSGLPYTILKPTMYMQNALREWNAIVQEGAYRQPYSVDSRMSIVDIQDIGQAAAAVLTEDGWERGEFELANGEILTRVQMAQILGEELGRPVRAEENSIDDWKQAVAGIRTPAQMERAITMYRDYDRHGIAGGNARVLAMMLGRPPTTYRQFVQRHLRTLQGNP